MAKIIDLIIYIFISQIGLQHLHQVFDDKIQFNLLFVRSFQSNVVRRTDRPFDKFNGFEQIG